MELYKTVSTMFPELKTAEAFSYFIWRGVQKRVAREVDYVWLKCLGKQKSKQYILVQIWSCLLILYKSTAAHFLYPELCSISVFYILHTV